jgi:hypothetical protein
VLLNGTRRVENLRTRSKIRAPQVAGARMMVPPVQMCCECAQCAAAIHLESQSPETLLRAAARERLPRRLAPAILAISNDAAPGRQWLQKMFFPEKAAPKHPPARHRRLRFGFAREARRQMRGYTRHARGVFSQFLRCRARPCANFKNVFAQIRAGQKPRNYLLPRHAPPVRRSTKPVLKAIHRNTSNPPREM